MKEKVKEEGKRAEHQKHSWSKTITALKMFMKNTTVY